MYVDPSWDLFIIVFFAIVVAYSFIIGRNYTLKIIIASYIATLAADGLGNILEVYLIGRNADAAIINFNIDGQTLALTKITVFVVTIVLIAIKGSFHIDLPPERQKFLNFFMTASYGVLSAGLLISTILVYASGVSFVAASSGGAAGALAGVYENSFLVRMMIDGYSWWFSLPAIAFVLSSFLAEPSE